MKLAIFLAFVFLNKVEFLHAVCPNALPTPPKYAIPTNFDTAESTVLNYYCPAHFVSAYNGGYHRYAGKITCTGGVWISDFKDCER